jgi:hypothetical protein
MNKLNEEVLTRAFNIISTKTEVQEKLEEPEPAIVTPPESIIIQPFIPEMKTILESKNKSLIDWIEKENQELIKLFEDRKPNERKFFIDNIIFADWDTFKDLVSSE